jgi:hypothetical protein
MDAEGCSDGDDVGGPVGAKVLDMDRSGPEPMGGGAPVPLVLLLGGPALGGGGVDFEATLAEFGSFLLIHFLSLGSYTKEDSSPSFALMGPWVGMSPSFFPNQPPNQPDGFLWRSGFFAVGMLATCVREG